MVSKEGSSINIMEVEASDNCFSVNRSSIPTVPHDEQNGSLYNLGIDIYDQEILEKGILNQADEAYEKQKSKEKSSKSLNEKKNGNKDKSESNKDAKSKNKGKRSDKEINGGMNLIDELPQNEVDVKVRMGEMTPFGSSLNDSINNVESMCFGKVEQYLREQIEADNRRKELKRKLSIDTDKVKVDISRYVKKDSPSSKEKNLPQKKKNDKRKVKKLTLGTYISEEYSDLTKKAGKTLAETTPLEQSSDSDFRISDSDYTDSEDEPKIPIPKKKKMSSRKARDYCSSDSSDSSDESDEESQKIMLKSVKKDYDDGNKDYYEKRLSEWEKSNNRSDVEKEVKMLNEDFCVPLSIWSKLFNYQKVGVQWLWELNVQRCGGILGDEMGLGKTIQVIALLTGLSISKTISRHGSFKGLGPVLIICPTTLMHQWVQEFHRWWPQFRVAIMHESGSYNGKRTSLIREINKNQGILVTSYGGSIQQKEHLSKYIWHYVILDEGHKIRNPYSQIANAVKLFKTPHRLILSGSPIQNNLKELWSLFDFIFPGKLGTLPVFMSEFAVPITQGGYANASQVQVVTAFKCAKVLRDTISPYLLRRVKEDVKHHINLPLKSEQVLFCKLTDEQKDLYLGYINSPEIVEIFSGKYKVFAGLVNLRKICNHPHVFLKKRGCLDLADNDNLPIEERYGYWKKSGKMIVVETLLKIWKKQNHRVLIFTQSRKMLKVLEKFVQHQDYFYLKLDGKTPVAIRQILISTFNSDQKYFVFLATTRVGGLGVNLTGADRVVIYDPDWNPATDIQARERAWRIGQKNQVTIYRLLSSGTVEEKIYHRQIFKQFLTNKVLRNPRQRRFFKSNDLYELFSYKDAENGPTETSALFAGSGSEVNLSRLSKRMKKKHRLMSKIMKIKDETDATKILSAEKISEMKKLAKTLSQKISEGSLGTSKASDNDTAKGDINGDSAGQSCDDKLDKEEKSEKKTDNASEKEHSKKKKTPQYEKFEGYKVPHLMGKVEVKKSKKKEIEQRKEEDDYILGKLFSKSEINTVMQHDRIMQEGPADYALVEGEAEKVAKEAVRALKESRRQYFQFMENGAIPAKRRFGSKSNSKTSRAIGGSKSSGESANKKMSSSELLIRMKERNRLISDSVNEIPTEHSDEHLELLTDIRNFISFEAEEINLASTQEIVDRFRDRLPSGTSPLFRALLLEICEFYRNSDGKGLWKLRPDFRW